MNLKTSLNCISYQRDRAAKTIEHVVNIHCSTLEQWQIIFIESSMSRELKATKLRLQRVHSRVVNNISLEKIEIRNHFKSSSHRHTFHLLHILLFL